MNNRPPVRLLALVAAALLAAPAARAVAPPVTLHPLAAAPRLAAPAAAGTRADPRAARLLEFVQRSRSRAAALDAVAAEERAARVRGQRGLEAALARLRARAGGEVEVAMDARRRTPRMLRGRLQQATSAGPGRTRAERTARTFLREQRALLRLADPDVELALAREERDELGRTHLRFRQRHRGVPVFPAELLVHLDPRGDVDVVNGSWAATPDVAAAPALAADAAVAQARAEVAGALDAAIPAPELIVWAPGDRPARLAWSVFVPAAVARQWRVVIDATSGALLASWNTAMDADVVGTGTDLLSTLRAIHVWQEGGTHYLVDVSKFMFDPTSNPPNPDEARGVITILDAQRQPPTNDPQYIPDLFQITSAAASEPAATWLADGVSAAVNFSEVYDYYIAVHGRDSLDGQGGSILAIVRLGQNFQNAFFLSEQNLMAFGDAEPYAAALDVVGHELTHGVTFHSANLVYRDEPGALNEAMSDIFGEMVEARTNGAPDWLVGSELDAPLRNMANPGSLSVFGSPYPSHYSQRYLGTADNGGVHINSSIVNHAFYQLAVGLSGNGIGTADAERIYYRALTVYLTANSRFVDARLACVQAAADLFGASSNQQQRVRQAFDLVGIVDGTATPPPPPFPGTEGNDSTLFLRFEFGTYFLYRLEPDLDGNTPFPLSRFEVGDKRPAVTGDGSLAWFVDTLDDLCSIATDGSEFEEDCLGLFGEVASVAVSPSGEVYGFVLRDPGSGERLNQITVIDLTVAPPDDVRTYTLGAPVTVPDTGGGFSVATVEFADALEISADDELVIYDALNSLQLASGGQVEVWSIYALERSTGSMMAIVPPRPGVDVGYPALAQRSDNFLVFDAVDIASGTGAVLAGNLNTGVLTTVASGLDGFSVPGYNGDDTRVIYSNAAATSTGYSLVAQTVSGRVTPQGTPVPWIADADYSTVYRRGPFVPEPGAGALGAAAAGALAVLARRRAGARRRAAA